MRQQATSWATPRRSARSRRRGPATAIGDWRTPGSGSVRNRPGLPGLVGAAGDRDGALGFVEQGDDLGHLPDMIGDASGDGRRGAQGLVNAAEVVVHEVEADRG